MSPRSLVESTSHRPNCRRASRQCHPPIADVVLVVTVDVCCLSLLTRCDTPQWGEWLEHRCKGIQCHQQSLYRNVVVLGCGRHHSGMMCRFCCFHQSSLSPIPAILSVTVPSTIASSPRWLLNILSANFGTFILALNPPSSSIYPPHIYYCALQARNIVCPQLRSQLLVLWREWYQTKHTHHRPWCGDGVDALGLGILKPHAMVGAKAASCHGWQWTCQIIYSQEGVTDMVRLYLGDYTYQNVYKYWTEQLRKLGTLLKLLTRWVWFTP